MVRLFKGECLENNLKIKKVFGATGAAFRASLGFATHANFGDHFLGQQFAPVI
jgi:hypothetical protein